jgi:hypothetical protein
MASQADAAKAVEGLDVPRFGTKSFRWRLRQTSFNGGHINYGTLGTLILLNLPLSLPSLDAIVSLVSLTQSF